MITPEGLVVVSGSTLKDATTCTLADVLRHALKRTVPDENGKRTCGSAVHVGMAEFLKASPQDAGSSEIALEVFDDTYKDWSDAHCLPEEWIGDDGASRLSPNPRRWENVRVILSEWFDAHQTLDYEAVPGSVESDFSLELAEGYIYRGRFDALVRRGGKLWVLDTKTTGKLDGNFWRSFVLDATLTGYVWAAEQLFKEPVAGVIIEGIQIKEIPRSNTMCRKPYSHGMTYAECGHLHCKWETHDFARSPHEVSQWYRGAITHAKTHETWMKFMRDADQFAIDCTPTEGAFQYRTCTYCDFFKFCEAGRPMDRLEEMTVEVEEH
jgi:hypothetical protein